MSFSLFTITHSFYNALFMPSYSIDSILQYQIILFTKYNQKLVTYLFYVCKVQAWVHSGKLTANDLCRIIYLNVKFQVVGLLGKDEKIWLCQRRCIAGGGLQGFRSPSQSQFPSLSLCPFSSPPRHSLSPICCLECKLLPTAPTPFLLSATVVSTMMITHS